MNNTNTVEEKNQEDFLVEVEPDAEFETLLQKFKAIIQKLADIKKWFAEWQHVRIIITLPTYKAFYKIGHNGKPEDKNWMDAYGMYNHLYYTGRLQETNSVWANRSYLINGLNWGTKRVDNALKWLLRHGFIEKSEKDGRKNRAHAEHGNFDKVFIKINHMSKISEINDHCIESNNANDTDKCSTFKAKKSDEIAPSDALKGRTEAIDVIKDKAPPEAVINHCSETPSDALLSERTEVVDEKDKALLLKSVSNVNILRPPKAKEPQLVKPGEVRDFIDDFLKRYDYSISDAERSERVKIANRRRRAEYFKPKTAMHTQSIEKIKEPDGDEEHNMKDEILSGGGVKG